MEHIDITRKLIGKIEPLGDSSRDGERFENLKEMCCLVEKLIEDIQFVRRSKDSYENTVKQAGMYADNFLKETKEWM